MAYIAGDDRHDSVFVAVIGDPERRRRLKAIAAVESAFEADANGDAGRSFGLLQLFEPTIRGLGFRGQLSQLFDPGVNLQLGQELMIEIESHIGRANLEEIFSAWNCGVLGGRQSRCRRADGTFSNQAYVNRAMRAYRAYGGSEGVGLVALGGLSFGWMSLLLGLALVLLLVL